MKYDAEEVVAFNLGLGLNQKLILILIFNISFNLFVNKLYLLLSIYTIIKNKHM